MNLPKPNYRACVGGLGALASIASIASIASSGCQDYPFETVARHRISVTHVREVVARSTNTDILFIIDNSGSMKEEQANLVRNTRLFIDELATSDNAYRVGVITTDLFAAPDGGRLRMARATASELSDAGCNIEQESSGEPYLVRPDPESPMVDAERCRLVTDFSNTVEGLGVAGAGREAGLEAARRAVDGRGYPQVTDLNGGFLRDDADLALIFLTDEDDCSFESYDAVSEANPSCYEAADSAIDPGYYVDLFSSLKEDGGARKVRAALIGGGIPTGEGGYDFTPAGCLNEPRTNQVSADCGCWSSSDEDFFCDLLSAQHNRSCVGVEQCESRCEALPARRYSEFIGELSAARLAMGFPRGTFEDSICQEEYDHTLISIARTVVLSSCFTIEEAALGPEGVEMVLSRPDEATGGMREQLVPRFSETDSTAGCQSCGQCPAGAWRYVDAHTFCLACGLNKNTGDDFRLTVMNELIDETEAEEGP